MRAQLGGVDIEYDDLGTGPGAPLVLIHGFTGHRDDFVAVRDSLALRRRVVIPDLRGHGGSSRPAPDSYTWSRYVADLLALLDLLGIERCHLLGHSMGGMVTLRFALSHPERLASLILMNTSPGVPDELGVEGMKRACGYALERGMDALQRKVEASSRKSAGAPASLGQREQRYWSHHRRRYTEMDPQCYHAMGLAMVRQESLVPRLHEIECPCLVVVGQDDVGFLRGADEMESHLRNVRRVTIPNTGHHPHEEDREAWLAAIEEQLESLFGRVGSTGPG